MRNICCIKNCNKFCKGFGFCKSHYNRFKKYGDPLGRPPEPKGYIAHGYRIFTRGRNYKIQEHRIIMEQHLGRKLLPFPKETVHHINGDKLDNRIENLQVISQSEHSIITHRKAIIINGERLCLKCNQFKPLDNFYKDKYSKTGKRTICKPCEYINNQIRYKKYYKSKRKSKIP